MNDTLLKFAESWIEKEGKVHSIDEIVSWIDEKNSLLTVEIKKIALEESGFWFFDKQEGSIRNSNRSFFTIWGLRGSKYGQEDFEQPIIVQDEIGYLGIICKEIQGTIHFLMQAKIEPGNVNKIQISPTIQATKSNFTQKHGGNKPPYLDYFINAEKYEIIVDQIQSEQSSRFFKKRNRNIIIKVDEEIELLSSHCWMTLGQIKSLMEIDNLVNMDTRTVISCIPFAKRKWKKKELDLLRGKIKDISLFNSIFCSEMESKVPYLYRQLNDFKMFDEREYQITKLDELSNWKMDNKEFVCRNSWPFKVVFCDINIEGREVKRWTQPLFEAIGKATFGLIMCNYKEIKLFAVKLHPEAGCFDKVEIGPTIQYEEGIERDSDPLSQIFWKHLDTKQGIVYDHLMSEEGGRFYHEQNRNVIIEVQYSEIKDSTKGYFLIDYKTLNELTQTNNMLNIQLRNLLALLEV